MFRKTRAIVLPFHLPEKLLGLKTPILSESLRVLAAPDYWGLEIKPLLTLRQLSYF